jgi:uncharacterized membrane-anchored protein
MKPSVSRAIIAGAVVLVLGAVNWSIYSKERIKTQGERVYLELAPVDPRSLMQGDYMALRFSLANGLSTRAGGSAPVVVDSNGVATLAAGSAGTEFLRIRYRVRNGQVWLGTNAYFFEEGTAQRYEQARYGEFRVDRQTGEAVLVALRDKDFKAL